MMRISSLAFVQPVTMLQPVNILEIQTIRCGIVRSLTTILRWLLQITPTIPIQALIQVKNTLRNSKDYA